MTHEDLPRRVLAGFPRARFAGIANSRGELVVEEYREGIRGLLSGDDVRMSVHYAIKKRELYTNLAYRIGDERYSISEYGEVAMITIPMNATELFLVSTEPGDDYVGMAGFVRDALDGTE